MKLLSELLESAEPEFIDYDENCTSVCDRESYDKMKAVAIELANALADYAGYVDGSLPSETRISTDGLHICKPSMGTKARQALTKARGMLEGEEPDPTLHCTWCGAKTEKQCKCPPRAAND